MVAFAVGVAVPVFLCVFCGLLDGHVSFDDDWWVVFVDAAFDERDDGCDFHLCPPLLFCLLLFVAGAGVVVRSVLGV